MPQLTIGNTFLRNELFNLYSEWGMAFWREMFQNSVDAIIKAGRTASGLISVRTSPGTVKSENLLVEFTDNGTGMNRDIIENVFMKLGETTKGFEDPSNKGGFGRARLMTHFAQERYEIITNDVKVVGAGQQWDWATPDHYRAGCQMLIETIPTDRWGSRIDLLDELTNYLKLCHLPCTVVINGTPHTEWTYRRKALKPLSHDNTPFGTLYVNKSAIGKDEEGMLLVRVDGTLMFKRAIKPKVQVIFEIDPAKSRDVLQVSRDSMHWQYRYVLDAFIDELNTETKSALRTEERESKPISGTGSFVAYRKDATAKLSNRGDQRIAAAHSVLPDRVEVEIDHNAPRSGSGFNLREIADRITKVTDVTETRSAGHETAEDTELDGVEATESDEDLRTTDDADSAPESASEATEAPAEAPKPTDPIVLDEQARNSLFDILMYTDLGEYSDAERKAVRAVIPSYNPLNWKVGHRKSQATKKNPTGKFFEGLQRAKLLLIWKTICHAVVQEALEYFDMEKLSWGVGWNFDSDEAKHHEYDDVHYLLVNPVTRDGKMRYELRSADHLDKLIALAIHEVVHVKFRRHDEEYASAITGLMARCLKLLPMIRKGIRDVYKVRMV